MYVHVICVLKRLSGIPHCITNVNYYIEYLSFCFFFVFFYRRWFLLLPLLYANLNLVLSIVSVSAGAVVVDVDNDDVFDHKSKYTILKRIIENHVCKKLISQINENSNVIQMNGWQ